MDRKEKIQLTFMILIIIFMAMLLFSIVYLIKNVNEIKSDPINYGMRNRGYSTCSCNTPQGENFFYSLEGDGGGLELLKQK